MKKKVKKFRKEEERRKITDSSKKALKKKDLTEISVAQAILEWVSKVKDEANKKRRNS